MRRPISSPLAGLWLLVFIAFTFRVKSTSIGNKSDDERRRPAGQRKCFAYAAAFIPFEVFNACASHFDDGRFKWIESSGELSRVESSRVEKPCYLLFPIWISFSALALIEPRTVRMLLCVQWKIAKQLKRETANKICIFMILISRVCDGKLAVCPQETILLIYWFSLLHQKLECQLKLLFQLHKHIAPLLLGVRLVIMTF